MATPVDRFLAAFVVATLLVARLPVLPEALPGVLAGLVMLAVAARWRSTWLLGCLAGLFWAWLHGQGLLAQRLDPACDGRWTPLSGVIVDLPQRRRLGGDRLQQRFLMRVDRVAESACRGPRLASLAYYGPRELHPGERWALSARLRLPWGEDNPGSRNRQDFFARAGIDATGSVRSAEARRLEDPRWRVPHQQLRAALRAALWQAKLEPGPGALLAALLIGDQSALTPAQWELLRHFGVIHLLVISGLHVSLVGGFGWLAGGLLARSAAVAGVRGAWPWLPALAAIAAASVYGALAGFSLPTQRALIMLAAFIAAALAGRRARSPRNLLIAAALVLALNPLAGTGSGFWLSFGAVAWLLWYSNRTPRGRGWRGVVALHVFMTLAMAPLSSWWFGGASAVAALANLLLVPFTAFFLVPLVLAGGACWFWAPDLAVFCWQAAAWPLGPLLSGARVLVDRQGDWLFLSVTPGPVEVVAALAGVLLIASASRWPTRLAGLLMLAPLAWPDGPAAATAPVLTVLDVGQGTSVVYRSGTRTLVYDTGGGDPDGQNAAARVLLPYLLRMGIRRIDELVISHPDRDHSAGVATLLDALPVGRVYVGRRLAVAPAGERCRTGKSWRWPDGTRFQLLTASAPDTLSRNDASCVLLIEARGRRFLLTGDIGVDRERELVRYWRDVLRADWLLVAHHGSGTSSSAAWLRAVTPARAVFTHGRANPFGHPAPAVLARFCNARVQMDATASSGAVSYRIAPSGELVAAHSRARSPRYWRPAPPLTPVDCGAYNP